MCQIDLAVPYEGWKDLDPPLDEDSVSLLYIAYLKRELFIRCFQPIKEENFLLL
jgi:hypothetical protein